MRPLLYFVPLLVALAVACAARPNRPESTWKVPVAKRQATTLRMKDAIVSGAATGCSDKENERANNLVNVLERELWDAGFEIEKPDEPGTDTIYDVQLFVELNDCTESLNGTLKVQLADDNGAVLEVEAKNVVFSNLRVGANLLVDRILASDGLMTPKAATAVAATSTSS